MYMTVQIPCNGLNLGRNWQGFQTSTAITKNQPKYDKVDITLISPHLGKVHKWLYAYFPRVYRNLLYYNLYLCLHNG